MPEADVGATPLRVAPALADLTRQLATRPPWLNGLPLLVDRDTYLRGREEMIEIARERGFPLATAATIRDNFLLRGVAIVPKDES